MAATGSTTHTTTNNTAILHSITTSLPDFANTFISAVGIILAAAPGEVSVRPLVRKHLVPLVADSEVTFVYSLALLHRLANSNDHVHGVLLSRIASELEAAVGPQRARQYASAIHFAGRPAPELVIAVTRVCAKDVQASDVYKLHSLYSGANPPPVAYIRTAPFVEALIKNVYGATTTDTSMIEEKMWLLAYVSSVIESDSNEPHNVDLVQPTMDALKHVHSVFPNLTPDIDLKNDFKALLDTVKYPVVAAGLLFWISNYIADPLFYNQNSLISGTERMLIFELLNEIAIIYPLQRAYALEILGEAIVRDYDKLSPLVAIEVKKKFLDQVIFLLKLGFVMPVLDFVLENSSKMDDALVVYFLKRVYELTSYPYHRDIMRLVAAIVGRIQADNLGANGNVVQLLLESFLISLGGDAAAKAAAAKEAENDFFADVNMDAVDAEAEAEDEALRLAIAAQLARKGK
ncbi:beta ketoadipyl CoA thiolase, th1 [Chytriomyces hyalinus]|nr:beta ketoadipyl CoA thiolase, th1 [Chytriomyces hyalinus]